ncbi:MAG: metallophosphoesterase family protein [Planctomycetota bacterium]|jgi:hypothetical protein
MTMRTSNIGVLIAGLFAALLPACVQLPPPPAYPSEPVERDFPFHFAVTGNTVIAEERTHMPGLILGRILLDDPVFLLHTGNLVRDGASHDAWWAFDEATAPLRKKGVPILPTRGVIDLAGGRRTAVEQWGGRFSGFGRNPWFSFRYKNLLVIVLDSNLEALGGHRRTQREWLVDRVKKADREGSVSFIFILMAHAVYSNTGQALSKGLFLDLVPGIEASAKVRVVLSSGGGTYERITRDGKWWISTAGGGGLRTPVERDPSKRRFIDAYEGERDRPFHFLRVKVEPTRFTLEAVALDPQGKAFTVVDRFVEGKKP